MGFWAHHGLIFLFFLLFFPRLTMLFAVVTPFGILSWLAWLFCPRLLAAFIGTTYYWHTNPFLCILAWIFALSGTGAEGETARRKIS